MSIPNWLCKAIATSTTYLPNLAPVLELRIGDVIRFDGAKACREFNLEDEGIADFEAVVDEPLDGELDFREGSKLEVITKASGSLPDGLALRQLVEGDAGIVLQFGSGKSFVLHATGVENRTIKNNRRLGEDLLRLYRMSQWDIAFHVVTDVVVIEQLVLIASRNKGARVELKATGKSNAGPLKLAGAGAQLEVVYSSGGIYHTAVRSRAVGLYRVRQVRPGILGLAKPVFRGVRDESEAQFLSGETEPTMRHSNPYAELEDDGT